LTGRAITHSGKRDVAEDECIGTKLAFSVYNVAIQGVNTIIDPADDAASSPHLPDILIEELREEAAADPQYADLIAVIETGISDQPDTHSTACPAILVYPRAVVDRWRYRVIRITSRDSIRFMLWYSSKIALVASGDCEDQTSSATDCVLARDIQ
jgi:hypothetical protein